LLGALLQYVSREVWTIERKPVAAEDTTRSISVSRDARRKPRSEILGRLASREDRDLYPKSGYNFCGQFLLIVRARAAQGYSAEITAEVLHETGNERTRSIS
jgi:hypothetical protein